MEIIGMIVFGSTALIWLKIVIVTSYCNKNAFAVFSDHYERLFFRLLRSLVYQGVNFYRKLLSEGQATGVHWSNQWLTSQ
jgi:hypothetical protein